MNRRQVIRLSLLGTLAAYTGIGPVRALARTLPLSNFENELGRYPFALPSLPYANDALEPVLDAQTFDLHHNKHHAAAVANLNTVLKDQPELHRLGLAELAAHYAQLPETVRETIRNNAGSSLNHQLFWRILQPGGAKQPIATLKEAIQIAFASLENLQTKLTDAANKRFGSGWAWMVLDAQGKLSVISTANQDSPLAQGLIPVLGIDVWEHAYYLKFQNRRADYVKAVLASLNWTQLEVEYLKAKALI